jgi:hypothetical protein
MSMTREEAEALAIETVEKMGCDLKLAAVRVGTAQKIGVSQDERTDRVVIKPDPEPDDEKAPQAYIFWFTREVDGVPTTYEVNEGAKAFIFFLSGTLWSLVGLALSTLTMSKYVSYASPFIIYYGLVIASTRYIKDLYCINPQEWLNPQNFWPGDHWGIILFLVELIVMAGLFFRIVALRRIGHE